MEEKRGGRRGGESGKWGSVGRTRGEVDECLLVLDSVTSRVWGHVFVITSLFPHSRPRAMSVWEAP